MINVRAFNTVNRFASLPRAMLVWAGVLISFLMLSLSSTTQAALPLFDGSGKRMPSLAPMLKDVNPAVVNISTFTTRTVSNPLLNDPFFRHFFNAPQYRQLPKRQKRTQSAGSGVIIDSAKGTVITNHHVIDGADEIHVGLADGRSFEAELIGSDPEVDIAVLKIKAKDLKALSFAQSSSVEVGDYVVAIGNPFGLGQTVTTGIVSALGRTGLGIEGYENFIQTDASINPGNSGGALVNLRGELVGVNTAIIAPAGGNVGIGFAIPTDMVQNSMEQILEYGEVKRGQLGVIIQDMTRELAEAFNLDKQQKGVLISQVQPGSAAEKAGIKAGDIVTALNGKRVKSSAQLRNAVGAKRIGDTVNLRVLRDGKEKSIEVKIGQRDSTASSSQSVHERLEGASLKAAPDGKGIVVAQIAAGSPASMSGLREGDVIVAANRKRVSNLSDLEEAAKRSKDALLLRVVRGNAALYIVLR